MGNVFGSTGKIHKSIGERPKNIAKEYIIWTIHLEESTGEEPVFFLKK